MKWIKCSNELPPKDMKFLFSYFYGIGIGQWGQAYKIIIGNSERIEKKYILILDPCEINDGGDPFQWDEKYMIEMEVSWMLPPEAPKEIS